MSIDWPQIILVSYSVILDQENESILAAVTNQVKHGCTAVLMGAFAATAPDDQIDYMFRERFGLQWRIRECTTRVVCLWRKVSQTMLSRIGLVLMFMADAVFLYLQKRRCMLIQRVATHTLPSQELDTGS